MADSDDLATLIVAILDLVWIAVQVAMLVGVFWIGIVIYTLIEGAVKPAAPEDIKATGERNRRIADLRGQWSKGGDVGSRQSSAQLNSRPSPAGPDHPESRPESTEPTLSLLQKAEMRSSPPARLTGYRPGRKSRITSLIATVVGAPLAVGIASAFDFNHMGALLLIIPLALIAGAFGRKAKHEALEEKAAERSSMRDVACGQVLYLRPFSLDSKISVYTEEIRSGTVSTEKIDVSLEEVLDATCLASRMNLVALGRSAVTLGPEMVDASDAEWKSKVASKMRNSNLILVFPAHSPGSFWELQQIVSKGYLEKTIWLMLPKLYWDSLPFMADQWATCAERCSGELGLALPDLNEAGAVFSFACPHNPAVSRPFSIELISKCVVEVSAAAKPTQDPT